MTFHEHWLSLKPIDRAAFAAKCQTSVGYLNLVAGGFKNCGETLALKIERESGRKVTVEEIRPDVPWEIVRGKSRKAA